MQLHGTAPSKTRGSFVAAALSTLQMFINEYVANNTQSSDFDLRNFAKKKTALYVLLPDIIYTFSCQMGDKSEAQWVINRVIAGHIIRSHKKPHVKAA